MSTRKVNLPQPPIVTSEESSEVLEKPSGVTIASEESGTDVPEQRAGGRRMNAALWHKWGNVRSKLRSMGRQMRSSTAIDLSHVAKEIATRKYSLMAPNKAAVELETLLCNTQSLCDFELRRRMAIVGSHLQLPGEAAQLSDARKAVLWAAILPAVSLIEAHAGTIMYEKGGQGDSLMFLLTGCVSLDTPSKEEPACWQPVGEEALSGQPFSHTCTAMEASSLASLSVAAFRSGVAAAKIEPFETARLLQLLFKAPNKRSTKDNEEIAVRLSSLSYFSEKGTASCEKHATFAEACPCPRGTILQAADVESDFIMVVLKGEAVCRYSGNRGAVHTDKMQPGELVAPSQDALSGARNLSAACTKDSIILYMPKVAVDRAQAEADRETTEEKLQCLRKLPGFTTRNQRDLLRLLLDHPISVKSAVPHQTLFTAGAHMNQVCIVLEGSVALSMATNSGMAQVVDLLPQEILCCGVLLQRAEPCTATANTKCKLLMIPDTAFKEFLSSSGMAAIKQEFEAHMSRLEARMAAVEVALSVRRKPESDTDKKAPLLRKGESNEKIKKPLASLLGLEYLDPGHYSLGVFASQIGNFRQVPQMSPTHAAKQMSSFMRMLMDPERPLTPAVPPPDYSDPPGRTDPKQQAPPPHPAIQSHATCDRLPPLPSQNTSVPQTVNACAQLDESQVPGPLQKRTAPSSCPAQPPQPTAACAAIDFACDASVKASSAGGWEEWGVNGATSKRPPSATSPEDCCQPPRILNSEVLAQFEVRRPASRIQHHTARRTAMLLSCGQTLDPQADVDLDSPAASHVAILPSVSHLTSGQLLRRAANDKVRSAQTWREERLAKAPLPAATGLPETFGWTQEEKYKAALMEMELQKLLSLPPEDQKRFLERTHANGKHEVAVLLKRGIRNDARPSGVELFKKVGILAKLQSGYGRNRGDPKLPLEVDKAAPAMQSRMAHPSMVDLNYVLDRWAYSWNRTIEMAVNTNNGHPVRVSTPSRSIRAPTDTHLFGFPLAPSAPPRDSVFLPAV